MQTRSSTNTGWCEWTPQICITLRYKIQTGIIAGEIDKRNLFYPQPVTNTIHITDQLVLQAEILSL